MQRAALFCGLVLVGAIDVIAIGVQGIRAQEKKYKPKAQVTPLVHKDLPGVEGKEILIRHFELPPGLLVADIITLAPFLFTSLRANLLSTPMSKVADVQSW